MGLIVVVSCLLFVPREAVRLVMTFLMARFCVFLFLGSNFFMEGHVSFLFPVFVLFWFECVAREEHN